MWQFRPRPPGSEQLLGRAAQLSLPAVAAPMLASHVAIPGERQGDQGNHESQQEPVEVADCQDDASGERNQHHDHVRAWGVGRAGLLDQLTHGARGRGERNMDGLGQGHWAAGRQGQARNAEADRSRRGCDVASPVYLRTVDVPLHAKLPRSDSESRHMNVGVGARARLSRSNAPFRERIKPLPCARCPDPTPGCRRGRPGRRPQPSRPPWGRAGVFPRRRSARQHDPRPPGA